MRGRSCRWKFYIASTLSLTGINKSIQIGDFKRHEIHFFTLDIAFEKNLFRLLLFLFFLIFFLCSWGQFIYAWDIFESKTFFWSLEILFYFGLCRCESLSHNELKVVQVCLKFVAVIAVVCDSLKSDKLFLNFLKSLFLNFHI
jgi:hypothetical protein